MGPLGRSFLLAGREGTVELPIDQEIGEDAGRGPRNAISPALDARGLLFIDEHVSAHNQLVALAVMGPAGAVLKLAVEASLEDEEGVLGRLDVATPCGSTGWRPSC